MELGQRQEVDVPPRTKRGVMATVFRRDASMQELVVWALLGLLVAVALVVIGSSVHVWWLRAGGFGLFGGSAATGARVLWRLAERL